MTSLPNIPRYFTKNVQINFICKECGYTVKNIPERFLGKRIKCHCQTIQYIPRKKSTANLIIPKELVWKTIKLVSVGALAVFLIVIATLVFRHPGGFLKKLDPIQLILNVVLPVFGIMLAGYLTGVFKILGDEATEVFNRYVFFIAFPAIFILSLSRVPFSEFINWHFLAAFCCGLAITFVITFILGRIIFNDSYEENVLRATSTILANAGSMGIPLFMVATVG